jgi:hypothetical protein
MQTYQKPGIRQEAPIEVEPKRGYWKWVTAIVILILLATAIPPSRKMLRGGMKSTEGVVTNESPAVADLSLETKNATDITGEVPESPAEERHKKKGKNTKYL